MKLCLMPKPWQALAQVFNARRVLEPALMRELCAVPLRRIRGAHAQ